MNKSILVSLTVAALSAVSPLAMAHSFPVESTQNSYLATRANMDSPAAISQAVERVQALQEQAARVDGSQVQSLDLTGRENANTLADFNAISEQVAADGELANSVDSPAIDYLAERRNLDSAEHISKVLNQVLTEQVSML